MTNIFSLTTLLEFAQMGAAYSRAGYDVATASYEKGPALLSSTIEEATILLSVGALAGLTAALVYFWRYAFLYPIQIVGGLCWDVFLCFLLCEFIISATSKRGPSRTTFKKMSPEEQELAKKDRKIKARASGRRINVFVALCALAAGIRYWFGSLTAAAGILGLPVPTSL